MRDEKIAEATKLLESEKISVQDFLNRMLWNDEELKKFFGDFESVDPCDEDDLTEYSSDDEAMDAQTESQPTQCNTATFDPTKCVQCRSRKSTFVTSCGHFVCDICWPEWIDKENDLLDHSNEPAYAIKYKKKHPRCLHCLATIQHTTKICFSV